jgi:hypothetical protein
MNIVYFLIGAVSLLIALLFFSLIALIWGLRQLLTISNQNDAIISFLQQISISIWHEPHIRPDSRKLTDTLHSTWRDKFPQTQISSRTS